MPTAIPAAPSRGAATREQTPRDLALVETAGDRVYRALAKSAGGFTLLLLVVIGYFLLRQSLPSLHRAGLGFLTEDRFFPDAAMPHYGIRAVLYWTVVVAVIALAVAVPVSILAALFITEYAPRRLGRFLTGLVDLLAAVPSLIYGLWGLFVLQQRLVPLAHWLSVHAAWVPVFRVDRPHESPQSYTSSSFVIGVVVSLMVIPITTSVMREVFSQTPAGEKEAALALGGSRWAMIRTVVLPFGRGGIIGGSMLGLGRALGETIAVAVIVSPIFLISPHFLEAGSNSIASLIANRFSEAQQNGLSALAAAGLVLFVVTLLINFAASLVVARSRSGAGVEA